MTKFLVRWLITAIALAVAVWIVDGIWFEDAGSGFGDFSEWWLPLALVALISTAITVFVKPILTILSIPFILFTLGLFLIVLNALLLLFTEWLADLLGLGFHVDGFWSAVWGSIIISITTWILDALIPEPKQSKSS